MCTVTHYHATCRIRMYTVTQLGGRKHTLLGHRGAVHVVQWSTCEEYVLATGGVCVCACMCLRVCVCVCVCSLTNDSELQGSRIDGQHHNALQQHTATHYNTLQTHD